MKFKAAITYNASRELFALSNDPNFGKRLMYEVVVDCLHVPPKNLGPATHYLQVSDLLVPIFSGVGLVVGFTMLSCARTRSDQDFENAMLATERIYKEAVLRMMPRGTKTQLFVALSLDDKIAPPAHMGMKPTNLIETIPTWIEGLADPDASKGPIMSGDVPVIWFKTNPVSPAAES